MSFYRVLRDGEIIADGLSDPTHTDADAAPGDHDYRVEHWDGPVGAAATTTVEVTEPAPCSFTSNKELTWADLPTEDPDNGSLTLVGEQVRDGVPVWVNTRTGKDAVLATVGEDDALPGHFDIRYSTRAVYKYAADFAWGGSAQKSLSWLLDVEEVKDNQISGYYDFYYSPAEQFTVLPTLDTSNLDRLESTWRGCSKFNQPLPDMPNITYADKPFGNCYKFNQPLNWNFSQITNLTKLLNNCWEWDQPFSHWDLSAARNIQGLFDGCHSLNQTVSGWDLGSLLGLQEVFRNCYAFNPDDLGDLNVSNIENFVSTFKGAAALDQDLSGWDVTSAVSSYVKDFLTGTAMEHKTDQHPVWPWL